MLSAAQMALVLNSFPSPMEVFLYVGPPGEAFEENKAAESAGKFSEFPRLTKATAPAGLKNSQKLEWPEVKATETYTHFVVSGNGPLLSGEFSEPVAVKAGDAFQIPIGALVIGAS